ncbi:MAG: aldehyde dehydrogenase family protein [Methanoregulaceae archaeon]|nr:aldehyde dehydrogenase family protein [Methanoregulaceae archaeon]
MKTYPVIIGGVRRETSEVAEVRFPYTGEVYARVCQAGPSDLDDAVSASVRGFQKTRRLSSFERSRILSNLADEIRARAVDLTEVLIMEGGKTRKFAAAEVSRAEVTARTSAEEAKRIYGEIIPLDWSSDTAGRTGYLRRFPIGPVLGVVPFNFPLNLACHKLAPALAAGNSVILKPASATPLSALLLGEMALSAGAPPESVSVVPCPGARAEQLARDPRISYLSFTGSCTVGWHLREVSGRKKVSLELGGNAAAIIHDDADLDFAVQRIVTGGFTNAGQVCISVQRVLIQRNIYESAVDRIVAATKNLVVGDPRDPACDVGPMIDGTKTSEALEKVQEAIGQGARVLTGGTLKGRVFTPTVISGTTPDMRVNREEVFAPVITVIPYDDFNEAVRIANTGDYGLQAGVFTQDIGRILSAFEEMDVGGVIANDIPTFRVDQMPYGGVRASGTGREGPRYAIEEMTEPRLLVINRRQQN